MRIQLATAFLTGMLCCALFMATAFGAFYALNGENDAQAQDEGTWHVEYLGDYPVETIPEAFIETLPKECDLVPSPHNEFLMFYRCPNS